jgi:hypothetical protein
MRPDDPTARVPPEFLGKARAFRERIVEAEPAVTAVMNKAYDPLGERARRKARPRPELIAGAARTWSQEMPTVGRLGACSIRKKSRYQVTIREVRLLSGELSRDDWADGAVDPGLSIAFLELQAGEGGCTLVTDIVVLLSLHALGRWFQRSLDDSEAALLADLAQLAAGYGSILEEHGRTLNAEFRAPVSGGVWAGEVMRWYSAATQHEERVATVATFLPTS